MLLTIAIPHSHDIDSLKSTLECLKGQQHRDVEILVNDNALGQEFRDVMADMSQELEASYIMRIPSSRLMTKT